MSGLTFAQALDLLAGDPAKYSTPEALKDLARQVSVDAPGKITTLYSGDARKGISAGDIVKAMAAQGDDVRVIGKTPAAAFLDSNAFVDAVAKAFGTTRDAVKSNQFDSGNQFLNAPETGVCDYKQRGRSHLTF